MKRFVCLLLCICIFVSAFAMTASAAYDETSYKLTGNQAADIVGIALTQVGYHDGYSNNTKYGVWAGNNGAGWCDIFISWCAAKAGVSSSIIPQKSFGGVESGMAWFKNKGQFRYRSSGYTPKKGDIIFFDWNYNGSPDHVGIVNYVDSNGSVHVIDGNFSDKVNDRVISWGGWDYYNLSQVLGYATPAYTSGTVTSGNSDQKSCDAYYRIATKDDPLSLRSVPGGEFVAELPKNEVIHVTKTTTYNGNDWGYTTYGGKSGWCHLGYTSLIAETASVTLTISNCPETVKLGQTVVASGGIQPLALSAYGANWASSDSSVLKVDNTGRITAVGIGSATITYTSSLITSKNASVTVEVIPASDKADDYYVVKSGTIELRDDPAANAAVVAQAAEKSVLRITETTTVSGVKWGLTSYRDKSGWCDLSGLEFIASANEISVKATYNSAAAKVGEEFDLKASIAPAMLASYGGVWSSSNESVATVDQSGHVKLLSAGRATLTYKSALDIGAEVKVTVFVATDEIISGDCDFDSKISVSDVLRIKSAIMSNELINDSVKYVYDLNGDSKVNVSDILALKILIMK